MLPHRLRFLLSILLIGMTLIVFLQVKNFEFLSYDDDVYITENDHVQAGLSLDSIHWAFTSTVSRHWHPITWLSHMVDCQFMTKPFFWRKKQIMERDKKFTTAQLKS